MARAQRRFAPTFAVLAVLALPTLLAALPVAGPAAPDAFDGAGPWMARAYFVPDADRQEIGRRFDHFAVDRKSGALRLFVADGEELAWLRGRGYWLEPDVEANARMREAERRAATAATLAGIPGYACYRTVEEGYASAEAIVAAHPQLASLADAGDSWEKVTAGGNPGYDLRVLVLTNAAVPGPKPRFFLHGAIHAREYTTAELALRFAEDLVAGWGVDADATWLLDHHEIHLLLQANPDGRKQAEAGSSWRKNTNEAYCGATSTSRGADLNRNFPFQWGCCGGSSSNACATDFRGASPASEPEVQAIRDYLRAKFPDQRGPALTDPAPPDATGIYLDLHSYSELVLWPWGFTSTVAPNGAALTTLGRKFAWFNGYEPQQAIGLYATDGTTDDFGYGDLGVASYTFELGTTFFQDCATFTSTILPANLAALRYAAKVVRTPYLTPAGPDALAVAPSAPVLAPGDPLTVAATFDDTRYSTLGGVEPSQPVAEAQLFVDTPPWAGGASPIAFSASDGLFDETVEPATVAVPTAGLAEGRHLLFARGRDAAGNWGAVSAAFVTVIDPASAPTVHGAVRDAATAAPLAGTVTVGPFTTSTDPLTGAYSLQVPPGTYDLAAVAADHVAAAVPGVSLASHESRLQDFALVPLTAVLDDSVELGNLGWTAASPWAITTLQAHSPTHSWTDSPAGNYANNVSTALTSALLDLSSATGVELSFWHRYATEATYDFCRVEVSTDGGSTWSEIAAWDGTMTTWTKVTLAVPQLDGRPQARVRFRLTSDVSQVFDGWYVDDIVLRAALPVVFSFADGFESGSLAFWDGQAP